MNKNPECRFGHLLQQNYSCHLAVYNFPGHGAIITGRGLLHSIYERRNSATLNRHIEHGGGGFRSTKCRSLHTGCLSACSEAPAMTALLLPGWRFLIPVPVYPSPALHPLLISRHNISPWLVPPSFVDPTTSPELLAYTPRRRRLIVRWAMQTLKWTEWPSFAASTCVTVSLFFVHADVHPPGNHFHIFTVCHGPSPLGSLQDEISAIIKSYGNCQLLPGRG